MSTVRIFVLRGTNRIEKRLGHQEDKYLLDKAHQHAHTLGDRSLLKIQHRGPRWLDYFVTVPFNSVEELLAARHPRPVIRDADYEPALLVEDESFVPLLTNPNEDIAEVTRRETEVAREIGKQAAFHDAAREARRSDIMTRVTLLLGMSVLLISAIMAAVVAFQIFGNRGA